MTEPARHLQPVPDIETGEIHASETPEIAHLRGQLFALEQDNRRLEKDLRTWREKYEKAVQDKDARLFRDKHFPVALGLIQEWKQECGHPNSSEDDPKRVRLALSVVKRYKGDEGRRKLSMVIQQAKHLGFVDPDTGFKFDEFGRIFGSSDEIEARATKWFLYARKRGLALVPERAREEAPDAA